MQRCLDLAGSGEGLTSPNPMVGAVIVYKDTIIGEGYHHKCGEDHAEALAIKSVKDKSLLSQATLYVNLEPCSHYGRTPPCSDRIIAAQIPRVVVGCTDPNKQVEGKGIEKIKNAGIQVTTGVLESHCHYLNRAFFTFHTLDRPYIILKWAQTLDGLMDKMRHSSQSPHINWITGKSLKVMVHRWRAACDAILAGTRTIIHDNPQLTVREWTGKNPLRLVVDEHQIIPENANVKDQQHETIIFSRIPGRPERNLNYVLLDFDSPLIPQILEYLHSQNIQSLIVEGGQMVLNSFLEASLWDEIRLLSGNRLFHKGLTGPQVSGQVASIDTVQEDRLVHVVNDKNPFLFWALNKESNHQLPAGFLN